MSKTLDTTNLFNQDEGYFLVCPKVRSVTNLRRVPDDVLSDEVKRKLPPQILVSPGQMRFVADDFFGPIHNFRRQVAGRLRGIGSAYVSAHIVPFSSDTLLESLMGELEHQSLSIRAALVAAYPKAVDDWCALDENVKFEDYIREIAPPVGYIEARIQFYWDALGFGKADENHPLLLRKAVERKKRLPDLLLEDIADSLQSLLQARDKEAAEGKTKISRRSLKPLKDIQVKVASFALMAPWATPLAQYIERIIGSLYNTGGSLTGDERLIYMGLLGMLADVDALKSFTDEVVAIGVDKAVDLAINVSQPSLLLDMPSAPVVIQTTNPVVPLAGSSLPLITLPGMANLKPAVGGRRVVFS